jgi:hypothetical protein
MATLNYYDVLELNKKATSEEIKQSYKKLALVSIGLSRNIILIKMRTNKNPK